MGRTGTATILRATASRTWPSPARPGSTRVTSRARARRNRLRSRAWRTRWISPASPRTLSRSGRHAGSSSRCSEPASLGAGLFLTRTGVSLGAVEGCIGCGGGPCNPCGSPAAGLREHRLLVQDVPVQGGGCPEGCTTTGEWFCCLTSGRVGCRFRCSECECAGCGSGSCHCFTDLPIPCTPRLHSGDQPCACPPDTPPIPALGV